MVESKVKRRNRSSSSSSSGSSTTSSTSSESASSSSSSSTASRSPTPKKSRTTAGRVERDTRRRSPRRSRSPRRVQQPKSEKVTVSTSRHSPSPAARRRQPSPPQRHRSRSPQPRRASPQLRRASPPARRISPQRERRPSPPQRRARSPVSPPRERRERTPEQQRRVCVRNLSRNVTKAHLEEIFALFGVLKSCELPMDRVHAHIPRGYGYVEYEKAEDAEKALKHMDGGQVDGLEIQCELTLPFRQGRGSSPLGVISNTGIKRERLSRSPPRRTGGRGASPPPTRRVRRSRSPPLPSRGANSIPLGNGGPAGRYRSPPRR